MKVRSPRSKAQKIKNRGFGRRRGTEGSHRREYRWGWWGGVGEDRHMAKELGEKGKVWEGEEEEYGGGRNSIHRQVMRRARAAACKALPGGLGEEGWEGHACAALSMHGLGATTVRPVPNRTNQSKSRLSFFSTPWGCCRRLSPVFTSLPAWSLSCPSLLKSLSVFLGLFRWEVFSHQKNCLTWFHLGLIQKDMRHGRHAVCWDMVPLNDMECHGIEEEEVWEERQRGRGMQ